MNHGDGQFPGPFDVNNMDFGNNFANVTDDSPSQLGSAIDPGVGVDVVPVEEGSYNKDKRLQLLRNQVPFMPILPWPVSAVVCVFPATAAENIEVNIPDGTKLIGFSRSTGLDIAVNLNGRPTALELLTVSPVAPIDEGTIINPPDSRLWYVEGVRSLTVRNLNTSKGFFSVSCYIQQ